MPAMLEAEQTAVLAERPDHPLRNCADCGKPRLLHIHFFARASTGELKFICRICTARQKRRSDPDALPRTCAGAISLVHASRFPAWKDEKYRTAAEYLAEHESVPQRL
jgi:hypothetical protein